MNPEFKSTIARLKQTIEAMATVSPQDVARLASYAKGEARKARLRDVAEAASEVETAAGKREVTLQPSIRHLSEALSRVDRDDERVA